MSDTLLSPVADRRITAATAGRDPRTSPTNPTGKQNTGAWVSGCVGGDRMISDVGIPWRRGCGLRSVRRAIHSFLDWWVHARPAPTRHVPPFLLCAPCWQELVFHLHP